ncbi:MAG TPA: LptF/LptG family permease [Candidatus Limnocylindria bacterium]|jgi:lipopolysaccharide export LptBFGC system permease protein LptF|nr:LptF/LptG family permease [Candidatus Limnocylindria bacterium]
MRLLDRYLFRELLTPLLICLSGFSLFWVAFDLFSRMGDFRKAAMTFPDVGQYYLIGFPTLLNTIVPVGFLLALLYALTNHARYHELTAMRAAGISIWRISIPYFAVGLGLSGVLFVLNEVLVPDARERQDYLLQRRVVNTPEAIRLRRDSVNFVNEYARRDWRIGRLDLGTMELRDVLLWLPLGHGAWRETHTDSARWVNGRWTDIGPIEEVIHRSEDDPQPAKITGPGANLPPLPNTVISNWSGDTLNFSNYWIKTNLVYTDPAPNGGKWTAKSWNSTNEHLTGIEVKIPLGPGAIRRFYSERAAWNGNGWLFTNGQEFIFRHSQDREPLPIINITEMPELDENPSMIRSELRVNSFKLSKALKHPELSLEEILAYKRLHARIRPEIEAWLNTQLHAHLAAPWTCLIVALIAVPFAAPSGRRNVFFGVAGSIGLALIYFVLQRLGFAMGQNGAVTPWLGAWLPNIAFALTGLILMFRIR